MKPISVIVPTYKCADALDVCLNSLINGQVNKNQIIVVVDGFYDINKEVLTKWKDNIDVLNLETNQGLCRGTNLGVYNAKYDIVLVINDDNVAPNKWDIKINENYSEGMVLTPNQIEPISSIFKQFVIRDLGRNPKTFDINNFWKFEESISSKRTEESGGTLPFVINKYDYLKVGGWDENYPLGLTADWEFFLKCQLVGLTMVRSYDLHFYHFESLSTRSDDTKSKERDISQVHASNYFKYKWGGYIHRNSDNNKKSIIIP
jgi:glycosyltransferase involved in cell wall biosynthesis